MANCVRGTMSDASTLRFSALGLPACHVAPDTGGRLRRDPTGVDIPTSGFIPGTFVQIEYSHAEYGDMTFRLAGSDTTGRLDNNANEIRVGFKYRFPDPTPAGS